MENSKVKLDVNNLKISFRTNNGRVQAVRNISFKLHEGETLAIVGESGSGKSVTSRAIMGILAPNAIVESGEILYDGKDLMQISEEEFHALRGDKIAMVFQDPLSSLNPIVKIGKQLTEAMILKNKLVRKESKTKLDAAFTILQKNVNEALGANEDSKIKAENTEKLNIFKSFVNKYIEMQNEYNLAIENIKFTVSDLKAAKQLLEKNQVQKAEKNLLNAYEYLTKSATNYTFSKSDLIYSNISEIHYLVKNEFDTNKAIELVSSVIDLSKEILNRTAPNFFSLAYYLQNNAEAPKVSNEELNVITREYLDNNFMISYIDDLEKGVINVFDKNKKNKIYAIDELNNALNVIKGMDGLDRTVCRKLFDQLYVTVKKCVNPLQIGTDSYTTTYKTSIENQLNAYFTANKVNAKNIKKYNKEKALFEKIIAKGKKPSYTFAEPQLIDADLAKANVIRITEKLIAKYENDLELYKNFDTHAHTVAIIDYLKELSSNIVTKVSKKSAKESALRIMEEVGIPEPEKRYYQYPFQFSGGMRQRIVIAIALSANPNVLICDEPTTALDVTIQAQILELINKLKKERNLSIIFITHDLGVVANMADRIAVMYAGKIVEYGKTEEVFYDPKHPYTWALLASVPDLETQEKLSPIPGTPPNMIYPPKGDAFAARNQYAMKIDFEKQPPLFKVTDTHYAATWLLHPNAPKTNPPAIVTERIKRMVAVEKEETSNE